MYYKAIFKIDFSRNAVPDEESLANPKAGKHFLNWRKSLSATFKSVPVSDTLGSLCKQCSCDCSEDLLIFVYLISLFCNGIHSHNIRYKSVMQFPVILRFYIILMVCITSIGIIMIGIKRCRTPLKARGKMCWSPLLFASSQACEQNFFFL